MGVIEVTEGRLKDLRADAKAQRPPRNEAVAMVVLSRAGRATPPGLYVCRNDVWEPIEPCRAKAVTT